MEEENSDSSSAEEDILAVKEAELRSAVEEGDVSLLVDGLKVLGLECGENEARNLTQTIFWASAERGKTECLSAMLESSATCEFDSFRGVLDFKSSCLCMIILLKPNNSISPETLLISHHFYVC